jgi:nucleoside-diphosphate-sugar epimerase
MGISVSIQPEFPSLASGCTSSSQSYMPQTALIGHTGFVGSNLASQHAFDSHYRSSDIHEIRGKHFDLVVCAGIQAKKWWSNQNPVEDWKGIENLLGNLKTVTAERFVLISTVDIYPSPRDVNEDKSDDLLANHPYGKHRFLAEEFVRERFPNHLVLRLPGLFGNGIKKNVIHDLLNDHELEKINPAGVYQYYYLDRLPADIEKAFFLDLRLLNISSEPVSSSEIIERFFPGKSVGPETEFKASYDMRSKNWKAWGSSAEGYLYDRATVLAQLGEFIKRQTAEKPTD